MCCVMAIVLCARTVCCSIYMFGQLCDVQWNCHRFDPVELKTIIKWWCYCFVVMTKHGIVFFVHSFMTTLINKINKGRNSGATTMAQPSVSPPKHTHTFELNTIFSGESINWCVSDTKFPDSKNEFQFADESIGFLYCVWSDAVLIGCFAFIFFVLLFCLLFVLHHVKLAHFLSHPEKSAFLDIIIKLRITHLNAYARDLNKRSHIKARIRTTQSNSELINAARKKNIILMNWNQLNGSQSGVQVCTFKIWPLFIVQHSEN